MLVSYSDLELLGDLLHENSIQLKLIHQYYVLDKV